MWEIASLRTSSAILHHLSLSTVVLEASLVIIWTVAFLRSTGNVQGWLSPSLHNGDAKNRDPLRLQRETSCCLSQPSPGFVPPRCWYCVVRHDFSHVFYFILQYGGFYIPAWFEWLLTWTQKAHNIVSLFDWAEWRFQVQHVQMNEKSMI